MVFTLPAEGNLASQLGSSLGRGLSETLPEGMKQGALSQGIRNLKEKGRGLSPIELLAKTYAIPNMTPEIAGKIGQYVRDENRSRGMEQRSRSQQTQGQQPTGQRQQPTGQRQQPTSIDERESITPSGEDLSVTERQGNVTEKENAFIPRGDIRRGKEKQLKRPTAQMYDKFANELLKEGGFETFNQARTFAKNEIDQNYQAQNEVKSDTRKLIEDRVSRTLQSQGLDSSSDLWGELTQSLIDQGNHMIIDEGLTPESAADRVESQALRLAKKMNNLNRIASSNELFKLPKTKLKDIKSLRKEFEEIGAAQQFDESAIAQLGLDPRRYASILSPVKNSKINKEIGKGIGRFSDKKLNTIARSIQPEDNVWAIMSKLGMDGTAGKRFKDIVQDEYYDRLTKSQKEQIDVPLSSKSGVMDIFFDVFGGKG